MLEMMVDIDRMLVTLQAAIESNLLVWVGFSCNKNQNNQMCLLNGERIEKTVKSLTGTKVDLISIMHTDVEYVEECLEILSSEWTSLTGVYAHSGQMKDGNWTFNDVIGKNEYSVHIPRWMQQGVSLVGGCCGITTDHMHQISRRVFFKRLLKYNSAHPTNDPT